MSIPARLGQTRLSIAIFVVSAVILLGVAPSGKADELYSLTSQPVSWPFQVPTLTTTNTTGHFPGQGTTILGGGKAGLTISSTESNVPEPSTLLLLGAGLASLVGLRRKRSSSREYLAYQGHGRRAIRLDSTGPQTSEEAAD